MIDWQTEIAKCRKLQHQGIRGIFDAVNILRRLVDDPRTMQDMVASGTVFRDVCDELTHYIGLNFTDPPLRQWIEANLVDMRMSMLKVVASQQQHENRPPIDFPQENRDP